MTGFARVFLRGLIWTLFALGLAAGIFLGRLSTGPVTLDWMRPWIEQALTPGNGAIRTFIGGTELRMDERRRTLELVGLDVRYLGADGQPFLTFPEVEIALSVEALLKHGIVAASRVEARAPSLRLVRNDAGAIGLSSVEMDDEHLSQADLAGFFRQFVLAPETDDRIAFLNRLQISGGRISFDDRTRAERVTARAADLVLIRQDGEVSGWLRADLAQGDRLASLQLLGRVERAAERVEFDAALSNLILADLATTFRSDLPWLPSELDRVRSPINAKVKGALGFDGAWSPLSVEADMREGVLDLPEYLADPLPVTLGKFEGVIPESFDAVEIESFRLVSQGATFGAKGHASWRADAPSVALDLTASQVSAADLPGFWPPGFGEMARAWVVENIKTGLVPSAEARLELRAEDFGAMPIRDEALKGRFDFEQLSVRYLDTMPPVMNGAGTATFNADRIQFAVTAGVNAGVEVSDGTVTITGLGKPGRAATRLSVLANVRGSVEQALALLDHPPLNVAKDLELTPAQTRGTVSTSLDIRLPLHEDVTDDEVDVIALADLSEVAITGLPRLGTDAELTGGSFKLAVGPEKVKLDGTAVVAGLPLGIDIEEPRSEETAKRRILLKGRPSAAMLEHLGVAIDGLDGKLDFQATLTETEDNLWIDLDADLAGLTVAIPGVAWRKSAGSDGRLLASIAVPNQGPIQVKQFDLSADDLEAKGSLSLAEVDYALGELDLSDATVGNSKGALRYRRSGRAGRDLVIEAETLDLDSLLTGTGDGDLARDWDQFHLAMRAKRLIYKGLELRDMQADASRKAGDWRTASFLGTLASGGKIALELAPEGDVQRLDVRSDDAGALIRALDLGQRVEGGAFHLAATVSAQAPVAAKGRLEIDRFTVSDAPLLARLLTVASLTGIGNLLEGEGIQFDQLLLPFSMENRKLSLSDGLLRGSQLGLTTKGTIDLDQKTIDLAGTIIPVYSLNRLLGQVPIIGRILTGDDGRGAFAATYQIEGPNERPTVYVNPLSMLTPGLIRDFFGGLVSGTLTPPEIRDPED